jgi:Ca2+-binding RTX toxin-like protein
MILKGHLIAVVGVLLMGCAILLVGCAGVREQATEEEQGHTEATTEEARCEGTRTFKVERRLRTTNDVPGCPKGGLLSGTDKEDNLDGLKGEDEIHGLGGSDFLFGGVGKDIIYGGPGDDWVSGNTFLRNDRDQARDVLHGGEDVLYGGDGNDFLDGSGYGRQRDKLYCGEGWDRYYSDENDYVDSSCEKEPKGHPID